LILLADFENKAGDPVFDETLKQAMAVDLEQPPYLSVIPDQKIAETLHLMGREPGQQPITAELAREVCQRAGAKAALWGSIASMGSEYVLVLKAADCATGESLACGPQ